MYTYLRAILKKKTMNILPTLESHLHFWIRQAVEYLIL